MHASETQVRVLLEGQKQFFVPLFQRTYSWDSHQWKTLWDDTIELYKNGPQSRHFLGSVVSKALPGTPEGVSPFMVIDGQQRLTTLSILLIALRDAHESSNVDFSRIEDLYLTNPHAPEKYKQKILPTPADRPVYSGLLNGSDQLTGSNVRRAFDYFRHSLDAASLDLHRLEQSIVSGLEVVSITLGQDDNEYRIFESLNAKGLPLSQADLIRNYFFMRIPLEQQEAIYHEHWLPMEDSLGIKNLEDFFRYQYMSTGEFLRERQVYDRWVRRLDHLEEEELTEELRTLARYSKYYRRLVDPTTEPHSGVRGRLLRLNRWGGQTMYPFISWAYEQTESERIDYDGVEEILWLIESFLVRRLFAGVPTNQLNRLFTRLSQQLPTTLGIVQGVRAVLSEPGRRWPSDQSFGDGILKYPLYTDSRSAQRRLILETLELSYGSKEPIVFKDLTVEHVMPQDLTAEWREELGESAEEIHRTLLHTLGNLTLTGYNPELSNHPYAKKREYLTNSHLDMNLEIACSTSWGGQEILDRGQQLAGLAMKLWPGPAK